MDKASRERIIVHLARLGASLATNNPYPIYTRYTEIKGNVCLGTATLDYFRYNGKWFD